MKTARTNHGHIRHFRFRTLSGLARQLGGNTWQVEHDTTFRPPNRTIMILREDKYGKHVVNRVLVPSSSF
ncbi:hypothetical protein [Phytoactinopolyspora halophila]|uniref:hypothetical protein n=1 Tax=Phytoactinopolyspora halophila TaxID=1981511 RepID=UPI000F4E5420|nr:hypothetical protein [Phytoactinopolyspora halophila]